MSVRVCVMSIRVGYMHAWHKHDKDQDKVLPPHTTQSTCTLCVCSHQLPLLLHQHSHTVLPRRVYSALLASCCRYAHPLCMASRRVPHVRGFPGLPLPSSQARRTWQTFPLASQGLISSEQTMFWGISKGFRKSIHVRMCSWLLGIC